MKVEAKITGQRRRPSGERHVDVPDGPMPLRGLIETVVRSEVDAFRHRQEENRLLRVLSPGEITAGVEQGRVVSGGSDLDQSVDAADAVAAAVEAFADGFYFVFLDDDQITSLDTVVEVKPDSSLLFVRLVPLAGG
jgi:hypothetical protein